MTGSIHPLLALAHVHRVRTRVGKADRDVFVFDHHRAAFTLWAWAARETGPLTLVTLDRHMDLETPRNEPPPATTSLEALDGWARWNLSPKNDDHLVAAVEAGAIDGAAIIARSHAPASLEAFRPYRDRTGAEHRFAFARTLEAASESDELLSLVEGADRIALDIDLDCFTTLSDADFEEVVPWDVEHIDTFLRPPGSERFWTAILGRAHLVTLAREPYHCGGLDRGARLWRDFAEVFFRRLLGVPPP